MVKPWKQYKGDFENLLNGIPKEDSSREGLLETPKRAAKSFQFLTSGYETEVEDFLNNAIFDAEGADELILVKDISFFSLCEHHILPFHGKVHVAYIPNGKIIGLSKIPRIVNMFSRRLQIQERLTRQIADTLQNLINPLGVGVVTEAHHMCASMRGVEKETLSMKTNALIGVFKEESSARAEFFSSINQ